MSRLSAMEPVYRPGHPALRRFRPSRAESLHFLTTNLVKGGRGLERPEIREELMIRWRVLEATGLWAVRTAVVMPDHVHLLVTLGGSTPLAHIMRLFKGTLSVRLRLHGLCWQEGFHDHELHASEPLLPIFLHLFLTPYRADLAEPPQQWPGYYCSPADWRWFEPLTSSSAPLPGWLTERAVGA